MAVYLICFDRPISPKHTCRHYLGYADNVNARVNHHKKGTSKVRLFEVAKERGIGFKVVRVWEDADRKEERRLKNQKNSGLLCPLCREEKSRARRERVIERKGRACPGVSGEAS